MSLVLIFVSYPVSAFAQSYNSTSYQVNEATFNSGGGIDANSASYNARGSAGNLGVGEATSASYAAFGGSITPDQEYLEMNVSGGNVDLGTISSTSTGIGITTFYVRAYINGGYVVTTINTPLKNGGYTWAGMPVAGASTQGTEQFGINVVANTSPTSGTFPSGAGTNPVFVPPSGGFANGQGATGYNTPNTYKYVAGDTIATSGAGRAWGQTNYTVTYIANASALTPGGQFTVDHDMVVVATY